MSNPTAPPTDVTIDPERWLSEHGDILYRYALGRLRNPTVAEDMVQETFLAAMKAKERFSGRSKERTWLIGILKHKIVDFFRKASRERTYQDAETLEAVEREQFLDDGAWRSAPSRWYLHPDKSVERKEFWGVLQKCMTALKSPHREAFTLRELEGLSSGEICEALGISESNLWVILHRTRMRLRGCLETNWVNQQGEPE